MAAGGEQVYATLLLSDSYLPGALVLAHSLRDARTTKKLAVLVTLDYVSADSITQLQAVYDYVLPVPRIRNAYPSNLYLMNRSDLHSAFTKINLWKQAQFSKIVYVDADVIAYRAPDELFSIPHAFAAAPDIGWPDLFNTGVMVLTPNLGDYYAMMAMAERGISFDGADQGLLNMHFKNSYHRISFTYNVTPSAHYQYVPAYRHFQSSINMVHFIGANKPWFAGRNAPHGTSSFDEMVGRWWAVYDRHYRVQLNNAWDEVPEIGRYVEGLQRHRRGKSQGSTADIPSPLGVGSPRSGRKPGLKLTDFPSETERPSLPVTPAPIARPSFWGHDEAEAAAFESREALPAAEGVPAQSEWVCVHGRRWMPTDCLCDLADLMLPHKDPEVQLQKLARQQYEHLLRKLGGGDSGKAGDASGHVIPKRPLPFGSENVTSPTYVSAVAPPNVARPRAVKPEASATGTGVRQTAPLSTSASATKGGPQESSSEGRAAKDDSSGPLLESPLPRTGGAGTGP
ncbi:glycogenin glucosyltransferase [Amphichorda felina]